MYTFFFILWIVLIVFLAIMFAAAVSDSWDDPAGIFIAILFFSAILWGQIELVPVRDGMPELIPRSEYSVMYDNNVAIVNYKDRLIKHDKVSEYNQIISGQFILVRTPIYNILDELKSNSITIKFKK